MTCHHFSSLLYGSGESKQLHRSVQKGLAALPSIQMLKWQWLTTVPETETAQRAPALRGHVEIYWVRDVTYLEGNGKVAEKFASKHLSCQLFTRLMLLGANLVCAALKMPVAAHWLKGLPVLQSLQSWAGVSPGDKCFKAPLKQKTPKTREFWSYRFSHTGFRSAHLVRSCCFLRESSWLC